MWRSGDARCGQQLFERHFDAIFRFFSSKVGPDCKDLTQQTFMACLQSRDNFAGRSSFRTWLFGIAKNVLKNYLHKLPRLRGQLSYEDSMSELLPETWDPLTVAPESRLLLRALRRLPIASQMIIELYYWEGLSTREIAEALELPLGTVTSRLKRGRERLERLISELASSPAQRESTIRSFGRWLSELRAELPARRPRA